MKMFTAMAVLKLRDAGRLRLDDSICTHMSNCPDAWKPVTIQELMRHTSFRLNGILNAASYEDRQALQATLKQLEQVQTELMMQVFKK